MRVPRGVELTLLLGAKSACQGSEVIARMKSETAAVDTSALSHPVRHLGDGRSHLCYAEDTEVQKGQACLQPAIEKGQMCPVPMT